VSDSASPLPSAHDRQLHILFVEDNLDDLGLVLQELERARLNFISSFAQSREDFVDRMSEATYDVIVSEYKLRNWSGRHALEILSQRGIHTPLVFLTRVSGDEAAVDCIKSGASDYVLKSQVARLPAAICQAISRASFRQERNRLQEKIRDSEEMFHTLADSISCAIFVYQGGKCRYASKGAEIITGYSQDTLLAMNFLELIHPESRSRVIESGFQARRVGVHSRLAEVRITTFCGETRWLDMATSIIEIEGKRGRLVTAYDVTERKQATEEMRQLADSDPLTGLGNYRRLTNAFTSELRRSRRTGRPFSVLLLDLNDLKGINDIHGHVVGSRALCRVGAVLQHRCRGVDILARYGGDEFAVILPETRVDAAEHLATEIARLVKEDGEEPGISVSYGLAAYPHDGEEFKDIIRVADVALYSMKARQSHFAPLAEPLN
jgi:two-component system, cell cycle response regulator